MSINNVQGTLNQLQNNTNQVNYEQGLKNVGTGKLDRQGFLQLLMAQMQYQDPTAPQDSSQMLSQQVQLEQVDQTQDLVNASKFSQAASLVGQTVTTPDAQWDFTNNVSSNPTIDFTTGQPQTVTGTVQSVQFDSAHNKALLLINGKYYDSDGITNVGVVPTPTAQTPPASPPTG